MSVFCKRTIASYREIQDGQKQHLRRKVHPGQEHVKNNHGDRSQQTDPGEIHPIKDHLKENASKVSPMVREIDVFV